MTRPRGLEVRRCDTLDCGRIWPLFGQRLGDMGDEGSPEAACSGV